MATTITDEHMKERLGQTRPFTLVILKKGPGYKMPDVYPVIWEHGRKNFALKADGLLHVVCPVSDGSDIAVPGFFQQVKKRPEKSWTKILR